MPLKQVIVLANRSPHGLDEGEEKGTLVPGSGGLATALRPLVESGLVTCVATARSAAEKALAAAGSLGDNMQFVDIDEELYSRYYDEISNGTLWFVHHGMYDRVGGQPFDTEWHRSWDAYRRVNMLFANHVRRIARAGAVVLVQDYHLTLAGGMLRRHRPDLVLCHFTHTPFAAPNELDVLPRPVVRELLEAMSCYDLCGFHSEAWESAFRASSGSFIGECPRTMVAPLGPDAVALQERALSSKCDAYGEALDQLVAGKQLIVRVDRLDPAKNLLRGFYAFDELLAAEPRFREHVVFLAVANPSRESSPGYAHHRLHVEQVVEAINARWRTDDWQPIVLSVGDDIDRSLAALQRYDVLLVNSIRDGMNLVAKEGPLLNRKDGVLLLSRHTGAWPTMCNGALEVNPFDVFGTRLAMTRGLDMGSRERRSRAAMARNGAGLFDAQSWLESHWQALGLPRAWHEGCRSSGGAQGAEPEPVGHCSSADRGG